LKKKIIIFGAYGYLGSHLSNFLKNKYFIIRHGRRKTAQIQIRINSYKRIKKLIKFYRPSTIINLIAETNVDKCERYKRLATSSNVNPIKIIVSAIKDLKKLDSTYKVHLIHISTDHVYNGGKNGHSENKVNPINFYAKTKLFGEQLALTTSSTVLRVNFLGKNKFTKKIFFTDWVINSLNLKKTIYAYSNVIFSPLHISTLCRYIDLAIKKEKNGIFNVGSKDSISKKDFIIELCKILKLDKNLVINTKLKNIKKNNAYRPLNMSLNVKKFEKIFRTKLPLVKRELKLVAKDYT